MTLCSVVFTLHTVCELHILFMKQQYVKTQQHTILQETEKT